MIKIIEIKIEIYKYRFHRKNDKWWGIFWILSDFEQFYTS